MLAMVSPVAYALSVGTGAVLCAVLVAGARRHPGPWRNVAAGAIGTLLGADAVSYVVQQATGPSWSAATDLPLALCNVAAFVAALACFVHKRTLVELTYFWGLAGALQAVATPDLATPYPHLVFFQYVTGHVGIVAAAVFLVYGLRVVPGPRAVPRIFGISAGYSALVGAVDWLAHANYMFLRRPPSNWTMLRLLGPWPWYIASAAALALVLFSALDAPFWRSRRRERAAWREPAAITPIAEAPAAGDGTGAAPRAATG